VWTARALALVVFAFSAAGDESVSRRPNILFLLADDLGYGDLGAYGHREIRTPHLDQLARQGLRFTQFYSNGAVCTPTRAALLTGRYPQRFGAQLREGLRPGSESGIPAEIRTLPELLRQAGYRTMHIGKWHIGHAQAAFRPLLKGYDTFFGFLHPRYLPDGYRDPLLQRGEETPRRHQGHLSDLLTAEAAAILRGEKEPGGAPRQPFFITVWFFSPHLPLMPPERWAARYADTPEGRYRALVSSLDESVGTLLQALTEAGLDEETIVVFMSDNGGHAKAHPDSNRPLRGGKNTLAEGGIRVPMIVRWPGHVPEGAHSDEFALGFDLVPTLAELAGVAPSAIAFDGRSLTALLTAGDRSAQPATAAPDIFWDDREPTPRFAVRRQHWKLLGVEGKTSLFDLRKDLGESTDLAAHHPELVAEMTVAYRRWLLEVTRIPYVVQRLEDEARMTDAEIHFGAPGGAAVVAAHPLLNPLDGEMSFVARICPQPGPARSAPSMVAQKGEAWSLLWREDGHLQLDIGGGRLVGATPLPEDRCSQVAFSYAHPGKKLPESTEPGTLHFFLDGVLDGSGETPGAVAADNADVHLGRATDGTLPFVGRLGDVRFWSTALTAEELPVELVLNPPPVAVRGGAMAQ